MRSYEPITQHTTTGLLKSGLARIIGNKLISTVVTILKYKKIKIDHDIYIKVFSDGTVSYHKVSTDDVFNIYNNKTSFPDPRRVF